MRSKHLTRYIDTYCKVNYYDKRGRFSVAFGYFRMKDYYKIVFEDNEGNIIEIPPHTIKYVSKVD